jgi:hypothetical protein
MPFKAELNYFFLYLQEYLQDKHGVEARRGDHQILTRPLMEKISGDIQGADCVIADVSGGNPNVLYEVGLAHAFQKPVIFLTQDDPAQTPVDVRQYEFIPYQLGRHKEFLANLDNAIQNVFVKRYEDWYSTALTTLKEFSQDAGVPYNPASLAEFQGRVMRAERRGETVPERSLPRELAQFFLPKIIADATDIKLMNQITEWLKAKFK